MKFFSPQATLKAQQKQLPGTTSGPEVEGLKVTLKPSLFFKGTSLEHLRRTNTPP